MTTLDQFRDLLQSIPYPCVTIYEQSRIVLSNRYAEHLFGYTAEELAGRLIDTLLPKLLRGVHIRHGDNYHPDNRNSRSIDEPVELIAFHRDGSMLPVEIGLSPVEMNGDHFILAIIHDITRHKQTEEKLRRLQEQFSQQSARLISLSEGGNLASSNINN